MWQAFIDLIANGLLFFNGALDGLGLPYSFGFAIILFTLIIKALTFPLNQKQMQSARATQELQPKLKELQKKYAKDKEKLSQEQMKLYKEAGVNPLGGCLPMIVQMPIWFALYRALYQLAGTAPALQEGFFWIPSLAGPVTDRSAGLSWLWPFPPSIEGGWPAAIGYLVLPVLLVVSQLYMQRMMTPQSNDPQQKSMSQAMMFMPFMFGYFALVVPSGLSLYWFTNNILSLVQQYVLNKQKDKEQVVKTKPQKAKDKDTVKSKDTAASKVVTKSKNTAKAPAVTQNKVEEETEFKTQSSKQVQIDVQIKSRSTRPKSKRKRKN